MKRVTHTVELTEMQLGLLNIACDEMVKQAMVKKSKVKGNSEEARKEVDDYQGLIEEYMEAGYEMFVALDKIDSGESNGR
jgi:hypothetical protein